MATDVAAAVRPAPLERGLQALWLFGPRRDLAIVGIPLALVALAALVERTSSGALGADANRMAMWTATNVLGNGTHVILTFLMFGLRPETMRSTPTLRAQIYLGLLVMTVVSCGFYALHRWEPQASIYARALVFGIFGLHHTLSQNRGWWSLYGLKERGAGLAAEPLEVKLQRVLVPWNLALVLVRYFLVAASPETPEAFIDVGQGAVFGLGVVPLLLVGWLGYWLVVLRTVARAKGASGPKLLYLCVVASIVGITLVLPMWGAVLFAGMHGLEYFFLSARMLEQRPGDARRVPHKAIWPLMALALSPFVAMGVVTLLREQELLAAPVLAFTQSWLWAVLVTASTACVLAHYWADALIYRFRLPPVRAVMLNRLQP